MMEFKQEFVPLAIEDIHSHAQLRKEDGWRYVQMLAVNTAEGIELIYSFMKDGELENNVVSGITKEVVIPSISDLFLEAFIFENETHDLFGVNISNIVIDFAGNFYSLAIDEPMTVMTPEEFEERKAARQAKLNQASVDAAEAQSLDDEHNDDAADSDTNGDHEVIVETVVEDGE